MSPVEEALADVQALLLVEQVLVYAGLTHTDPSVALDALERAVEALA